MSRKTVHLGVPLFLEVTPPVPHQEQLQNARVFVGTNIQDYDMKIDKLMKILLSFMHSKTKSLN